MKIIFEENELLGLKESCIYALNRLDEKENSELFRFIQIATDIIFSKQINEKNNEQILNVDSFTKELKEEYLNILNKLDI